MSFTGRLRRFFGREKDEQGKQDRRIAKAEQQAKIVAERARAESKYTPG